MKKPTKRCCLVPMEGPDHSVSIPKHWGTPETIQFQQITYQRTGRWTEGGWAIFKEINT